MNVLNHSTSSTDLVSVFNRIDADGNGAICKSELWNHVSSRSKDSSGGSNSISSEDFDKLFYAIDTDKSGSIDFGEFSDFMDKIKKLKEMKKDDLKSSMKVSTLRASLLSSELAKDLAEEVAKEFEEDTAKVGRSSKLLESRMVKSLRRSSLSAVNLDQWIEDTERETLASTERGIRDSTYGSNSVRFFDVEVRQYGMVASCNPCVSSGVALELSWEYDILERCHLDTFEDKRSEERSKNYSHEKKLSRLEREKILREYGATQQEIQQAAKRATIIRNSRMKSIGSKHLDKVHEKRENRLDSLKKKFRRRLSIGGRRKSDSSIEDLVSEVDLERLHPTLMMMLGVDDDNEERHDYERIDELKCGYV